MKLNPASRVRLRLAAITTNFEPVDTTVEVGVDDQWYPATWRGEATHDLGARQWTWQAESDDYFCGPEVEDETAVTLELGTHKAEVRLTTGDQIVAFVAGTITVAE